MDLETFIQRRRPQWRQLEEVLNRVEGSGLGALTEEQAVGFGRLYRGAASDLNQAQTFVSGDTTVQYLNDLVARCYLVIYANTKADPWGVLRHLLWDYPAVFRRYARHFLVAAAFVAAGAVFGFLASYYDVKGKEFLLPNDMPMVQPGGSGQEDYAPAASVDELAGFSGFLFRHNVSVTLAAFALGMTFGVGTVWLMVETGIMIGALAAVFAQAGEFRSFCTAVLPHGVLEIPAAVIGGAAGLLLAQGMIRARPWPRLDELARTGKEAVLLVSGCFPLLAVAAILEAGVARAPYRVMDSGFKLAVAGVFGLLFVAYVLLPGWRKPAARAESVHAAP
ncbi:MAG TPA: stage II sporulation protein M [Gemmataceae bacterium]|jgi:uncharacterized membrane protein SpoIIM required for sporulation|nr:stage II sporulation protein M [Gemmataceae bacterium]